MPYDVQVKEVRPQPVLSVRRRARMSDIAEVIGGAIGEVFSAVSTAGTTPSGPPVVVYHEPFDQHTGGDLEVCVPVAREAKTVGEVRAATLAGGTVATLKYRGTYDRIGIAYDTLAGWIEEQGLHPSGPPREIYITDPQQVGPEDCETEIDWPVS